MEMEQKIIQAALATTHPLTSIDIRASASHSLEQWTNEDSSWTNYYNLLRIFFTNTGISGHGDLERIVASSADNTGPNSIENNALGVKLLLLTMMRSKCRNYKYRNSINDCDPNNNLNKQVNQLKAATLQVLLTNIDQQLIPPLCSSIVALSIRLRPSDLRELISGCCTSIHQHYTALRTTPVNNPIVLSLSPALAVQILSNIPEEVQLGIWTGEERDVIHGEMRNGVTSVLNCVMLILDQHSDTFETNDSANDVILLSLQMLIKWIESCNINLIELHKKTSSPSPDNDSIKTFGTRTSLLSMLMQVLSHPNPLIANKYEQILQYSSQAVTEAIQQPTFDAENGSCNLSTYSDTTTHTQIITFLLTAMAKSGFITNPFTYFINQNNNSTMYDSIRHLTNLAIVIAVEEINTIATCQIPGCTHLIELLIQAQIHPNLPLPIAINTLEVWLALQDIPTSERNAYFTAPLFHRILTGILEKMQYTPSFTTWEDEHGELDVQEFNEFRRLVKDVLISCYFLLRAEFIQKIGERIVSLPESPMSPWFMKEAALFSICAAGREICARVKARGGNNNAIMMDKDATIQKLLQMAQILCAGGAEIAITRQHPLVLSSVSLYLGTFAPVWNVCADIDVYVLSEMLNYLKVCLSVEVASEESAQSIKKIFIACSSKFTNAVQTAEIGGGTDSKKNIVLSMLPSMMDGAFAANKLNQLKMIAGGCARLIVQFKPSKAKNIHTDNRSSLMQRLLEMISEPVLQRTQQALDIISSSGNNSISETQVMQALTTIPVTLQVMNEIIRYCDGPNLVSSTSEHPLTNVLNVMWPTLSAIANSSICRKHEEILTDLLSLYNRIFSTVPSLVSPYLSQLITFVVQAFEETHLPCTLDCIAEIVEVYGELGSDNDKSFSELLVHLINCSRSFLTQESPPYECPQVIRALFDMTKRYLLFCPRALLNSTEFETIFALAVACLKECRGERDSTRASINFLTQLFCWRTLKQTHLSDSISKKTEILMNTSVAQHGENITKFCVCGISGGSPQMLWPALSECLFSLVQFFVTGENGLKRSLNENSPCYRWVVFALSDESIAARKKIDDVTRKTFVDILFRLSQDGSKSKPMVKMLLNDFGSICKGEKTSDCLLSYFIQNER